MRRKLAMMLLFSVLLFTIFPTAALAIENIVDEKTLTMISPRLTYIVDAESGLSINGTTATVDCWVKGNYGDATKAKVIAELQVESGTDNWIPVAIWTETMNGYESYVYETKNVTKGNNYRVKGTFTVWEGNQSETIYLYTDEMTA